MSKSNATAQWRLGRVRAAQRGAKQELDREEAEHGAAARLALALRRVRECEAEGTPDGDLRCYVYVMSALYHHRRAGGLKTPQVQQLAELAKAILDVHGINPDKSTLRFLHADLHLVMSQILRKTGRQWEAAWTQQMSAYLSPASRDGSDRRQMLAFGIRALRLGQGDLALSCFEKVEGDGAERDQLVLARLSRAKILRLRGALPDALGLLDEARAGLELTHDEQLDFAWEAACCEVARTGDIEPLLAAVGRNGEHQAGSYLLETFLWTRAASGRRWLARSPSVTTLARKKALGISRGAAIFRFCKVIEDCYDADRPMLDRLAGLGRALSETGGLLTVDHELLFHAAACRWLRRRQASNFSALCQGRYEALSLSLSGGARRDALGILKGLIAEADDEDPGEDQGVDQAS